MSFFDGQPDLLLVSRVPVMQRVLAMVEGVAAAPTSVLLTGESGTGKDVIAEALHRLSDRRQRPFVAVNCAAIPATLIESELFGHEKGAFSGAIERKVGVFERSNGGTLFLDEIGELPLELQAKILRVIQDRTVTRLGGTHGIVLDVRLVAATNRDLGRMVATGQFRQDLFYRLNVFPIALPPLRVRKDDLPALAQTLLVRLARRHGRGPVALEARALARLSQHDFPGNIRELQNVLERALVLGGAGGRRGGLITEDLLVFDDAPLPAGRRERRPEQLWGVEPASAEEVAPLTGFHGRTLSDIEREVILTTLERQEGNRTRTSDLLGISIRTLRNRLREYRELGFAVADAPFGVAA